MTYFLLLTAFTVSIDSFVCGFSLSNCSKKKLPIVIIITTTVFIMCALTNYMTLFFSDRLTEKTASVGGFILIGVGLYNLLKKKGDEVCPRNKSAFKLSLLTGLAVGLDGAAANLSLALMGINAFYVPLTIAVMHALTVSLGIILSQTVFARKFAKIEFIPPIILILLGGYKILGLFI